MLTVGSLFSGIGGFDLGLERAGMRVLWQSEIDQYASAVLRKHWPNVPNHGDIRKIHAGTVEPVDLICGGFPCQPFSHAGVRRGKDDDRHLWPEMLRVIGELRPAWVLGENVPGIISMELDQVLSDLEALDYATRAFVIPAVAVDAPHRRDRVWIVGNANHGRREQRNALKRSISKLDAASDDPRRADADGNAGHSDASEALRAGRNAIVDVRDRDRKSACAVNAEAQGMHGDVADADESGSRGRNERGERTGECAAGPGRWPDENDWFAQSGMGRVAHGVPRRVDRLRCLGNAVVPQIVEVIGRAIIMEDAK